MDSSIKRFLLLFIAAMPLALAAHRWDILPADTIPKEYVTHRIVSEELRNLISEYDKMYAQYSDDPSMGIVVYCTVNNKSITYGIGYIADIGNIAGLIVCEPINGKEVVMRLTDLRKQIELPKRRSVELLKNSNFKEYEWHKRKQKEVEDNPEFTDYGYSISYDFVSWEIVFDKRTGECLRKYTPDWTKHYQKEQKRNREKTE